MRPETNARREVRNRRSSMVQARRDMRGDEQVAARAMSDGKNYVAGAAGRPNGEQRQLTELPKQIADSHRSEVPPERRQPQRSAHMSLHGPLGGHRYCSVVGEESRVHGETTPMPSNDCEARVK
jgi:hypothetical protein